MTAFRNATPEQALRVYKPLVESTEQAMTVLMTESAGKPTLTVIQHRGIQSALAMIIEQQRIDGTVIDAVLLSAEVWVKTYAEDVSEEQIVEDEPIPTSLSEAVTFVFANRDGVTWCATQEFVRTNEGVRWNTEHGLVQEPPEGGAADLLREMVGVR